MTVSSSYPPSGTTEINAALARWVPFRKEWEPAPPEPEAEPIAQLAGIQERLGMRIEELARALRVTREAIRKWRKGSQIRPENVAAIYDLAALSLALERHWKPGVLKVWVRRHIPACNGQTPLEWIQAGRGRELHDALHRYDWVTQ